MVTLNYENEAKAKGFDLVIGVDEAGRGPLAGPVVASAVALRETNFCSKIDDSKKISPRQREKAFHEILEKAYVGIGIIGAPVIDKINILRATFLAMDNAIEDIICNLPESNKIQKYFYKKTAFGDGGPPRFASQSEAVGPHRKLYNCLRGKKIYLLIDGNRFKSDLLYDYKTIISGDKLSMSIACASIIAKVTRDRMLNIYDKVFPEYGFGCHKGYPTLRHKQALRDFGHSIIHRKTFKF